MKSGPGSNYGDSGLVFVQKNGSLSEKWTCVIVNNVPPKNCPLGHYSLVNQYCPPGYYSLVNNVYLVQYSLVNIVPLGE